MTNNEKPIKFFKAADEEYRFSYLGKINRKHNYQLNIFFKSHTKTFYLIIGYSVASVYTDSQTLYISGAPRYNLTGAVFIFDGKHQDLLQGDQV